jgi:hypothetical protein
MGNRVLTKDELEAARAIVRDVRERLSQLGGGDKTLLFAYRRKVYKELIYDERGTPAHRNKIKRLKMKEQNGLCPLCRKPLPEKNAVLDRFFAPEGYTVENTRLVHDDCDRRAQSDKGYA